MTEPAGAVDDELWSAVGDPTRRRMLDRVGLVHGAATGRERHFWVDDTQLARAAQQLANVGSTWDGRLRRIARIAEQIERQKSQNPPKPQAEKAKRSKKEQ